MALTAKQEQFAQNIAKGMTQADAYRNAYNAGTMSDNAIYVSASRLLDDAKIKLRVDALKSALAKKELWTREQSVKGLIAAYDIANEDRNTSGMVNSVKELNAMHGFNAPAKVDLGESLLEVFAKVVKNGSN